MQTKHPGDRHRLVTTALVALAYSIVIMALVALALLILPALVGR